MVCRRCRTTARGPVRSGRPSPRGRAAGTPGRSCSRANRRSPDSPGTAPPIDRLAPGGGVPDPGVLGVGEDLGHVITPEKPSSSRATLSERVPVRPSPAPITFSGMVSWRSLIFRTRRPSGRMSVVPLTSRGDGLDARAPVLRVGGIDRHGRLPDLRRIPETPGRGSCAPTRARLWAATGNRSGRGPMTLGDPAPGNPDERDQVAERSIFRGMFKAVNPSRPSAP